ncbi:MAG: TetR family transcriptional regulator C-terminal domain-containing protein, partial [Chloroflexi bacterium]|nr:TetR family transcriptional regulator C-terminal domain-containing protein [Chloroflexota bacterium]
LGKRGDSVFTYRFRQLSEQRYRHLFSRFNKTTSPQEPPVEMQLHYISYAFVGAVLWWLEHDLPFTAEQFTTWLSRLSMTTAGISIEQLLSPSSAPA